MDVTQCQETQIFFDVVQDHLQKAPAKMHPATLSSAQLIATIACLKNEVKDETLLHLNAEKSLSRLQYHKETWVTILKVVGSHDVPGLHQLFRNVQTQNWSANKLLKNI
ncbi:hypothetical protein BDQ17DRAFT_1257617 [Cyathus striatus]|nr:hypothetical protein BDQ17DRAFT_1257617 [Cyathus striatus]